MNKRYENLKVTFLLTIFLCGVFAVDTAAQTCQPAPVGLVSWWSADGNALDARSRNDGALQGNVTFVAGQSGQAFRSGGTGDTSGNGDRINVGNPPNLRLQDFTIEAWIRRASSTVVTNSPFPGFPQGVFFAYGQDGYAFLIDEPTNRLGLTKTFVTGVLSPELPITDTNFHHVAVTKTGNQVIFYVDGAASTPVVFNETFAFPDNAAIGAPGGSDARSSFFGDIDELSIYNRALTAVEIAAIHAAGTAGKCKPTATAAPSGLVGWWAGDGNTVDLAGTGNALLNGNAFAVAKSGQGFRIQNIDGISVADNAAFNQQNFTVEGWVTAQLYGCEPACAQFIAAKSGSNGLFGFDLGTFRQDGAATAGAVRFTINGGAGGADLIDDVSIADGNFHHVAASYDGATMKIFVDGVLSAQKSITTTINYEANSPLVIGSRQGALISTQPYNGLIDELSFYDRPLSDAEIKSIFSAGIAGKLKQVVTPLSLSLKDEDIEMMNEFKAEENSLVSQDVSPQGSSVSVGDATIFYPSVTAPGMTHQIPLDAALFPSLPGGMYTGLFYDIDTDAVFTGNPTVCFNLPSFDPMQFKELRVIHLEEGIWVDVTDLNNSAFPTLCTVPVSSFSPFAIVASPVLSASVSVGGQVFDSEGRAVYRAEIVMTDPQGRKRTALTNQFGYYRIDGVPAGTTYFFDVRSKAHQFPSQAVTVNDNIGNLNFTALP